MDIRSRLKWSLWTSAGLAAAAIAAYAALPGGAGPGVSAEASGSTPSPASASSFAVRPSFHSTASAAPPLGSRDTVDVTSHVPRASGAPCIVELFDRADMVGNGFEGSPVFSYAPPANCAGPWAKVMIKVTLENDAPIAFTDGFTLATVAIGGVPLYAGGAHFNYSVDRPARWRAERDVTDYSALLRVPGDIVTELSADTYRDRGFYSTYRLSASLLFYPANSNSRAQRVPDQVVSLGNPVYQRAFQRVGAVGQSSTQFGRTLALPRNVERAYLDVIAQPGYGNDLHWFTCMPDALLAEFWQLRHPYAIGPNRVGLEGNTESQGCGGGSFREVLVSIDGQPAGIAPVFPQVHPQLNEQWGSTPLFQPSPAPRTLSYLPYRVDLTPFAGLLSDGMPHTVSIAMGNATGSGFDVSGTLLVYRDAASTQITGQVTRNTMPATFVPTVSDTLRNTAGEVRGVVNTRSHHQYEIDGFIDTARGRIETRVSNSFSFRNRQTVLARDFDINQYDFDEDAYMQTVQLESRSAALTRRWLEGTLIADDAEYLVLPLTLVYRYRQADLHQIVSLRSERWRPGVTRYYSRLLHEALLNYHAPATFGEPAPSWQATQNFLFRDSHGSCHTVGMSADQGALSAYRTGLGCPDGRNRLFWASHPDGSPDSLGWAQ
jgi:hypothetical protein